MKLVLCQFSQKNAFLVTGTEANDTQLYVPVVTLSTKDNVKLLSRLQSGFKRTTDWNKYQSKITVQEWNKYLDFLIDPSFQGI